MNPEVWPAVDRYLTAMLHEHDPSLDAALEASAAAGLPPIQVSPNQGKLLHLLARIAGARRILEIGTLGGYSTIWLARALPAGGRLISLELKPSHADVATRNLTAAGVGNVAEVRIGRAVDTLAAIAAEETEPFDFVFIDADKPSNAAYFEWALRLTRAGSVIVIDNVVRNGAVADSATEDEAVLGVRQLLDLMRSDTRVTATAIQTVGAKGYDGFAIALVL